MMVTVVRVPIDVSAASQASVKASKCKREKKRKKQR